MYWFCHTLTWIWHECTCVPHPEPPSYLPPHPIPVSCIEPGLAIHFTYDILHVSVPFSHIILPLPSPTESKSLFYISVSLLLSRIQGRIESDTTERLHFHFSLSCIGEGNGNPLQCSCLANPRDRGAWWAAVYGVAQSRTRLKQLSSSSSSNKYTSGQSFYSKKLLSCRFLLTSVS